VYQVCDQLVAATGDTTACKQQHVILNEQHRLLTAANGKVYPHPRQGLITDLTTQLREWRSAGLEILLSGDLNEILGENPSEFAKITTEFNLTDIYRHRHGLDKPATYQRGHRRFDYILCTSELLPAVMVACGIMPFKQLSASDHCTVFVDFDTNLLFGSLPSELASPKQNPFHSRNYENSKTYITHVNAYCEEHDLYRRSEAAMW
jgi:exonuclease III